MDYQHFFHGLGFWLILLCSLCVHEWAHAIVADWIGDPTPRFQGRVTLNPIAHIDPIGTVLIPLIMILLSPGFSIIGWGKPVQVNPRFFKNPVTDDLLVTLAGPAANFALAFLLSITASVVLSLAPEAQSARWELLFGQAILLNCLLIVFNLLPLPPLDGSHVMKHLVRMSDQTYQNLSRYGFIILIVLLNFTPLPQFLSQATRVVSYPFFRLLWTILEAFT